MKRAVARANANIALAKYWGKADAERNLPAVPSISMTLDGMTTTTRVAFDPSLNTDALVLNGEHVTGRPLERVRALLDRVRAQAGIETRAHVETHNDFPTASGLASSASGFAALALAARAAADLPFDAAAASALARQSSASAARSVFGGYVALDLLAPSARRVAASEHFRLELVVAVTERGPKSVGSTEGMQSSERTSPYYRAWVEQAPASARAIEAALCCGDIAQLGPRVEHSALSMHACMWAAVPPLVYFTPATLAVMQCVRKLQAVGLPVFFTMDAGPHVKVITLPQHAPELEAALVAVPGVLRTIHCRLGPDASVSVEHDDAGQAERER